MVAGGIAVSSLTGQDVQLALEFIDKVNRGHIEGVSIGTYNGEETSDDHGRCFLRLTQDDVGTELHYSIRKNGYRDTSIVVRIHRPYSSGAPQFEQVELLPVSARTPDRPEQRLTAEASDRWVRVVDARSHSAIRGAFLSGKNIVDASLSDSSGIIQFKWSKNIITDTGFMFLRRREYFTKRVTTDVVNSVARTTMMRHPAYDVGASLLFGSHVFDNSITWSIYVQRHLGDFVTIGFGVTSVNYYTSYTDISSFPPYGVDTTLKSTDANLTFVATGIRTNNTVRPVLLGSLGWRTRSIGGGLQFRILDQWLLSIQYRSISTTIDYPSVEVSGNAYIVKPKTYDMTFPTFGFSIEKYLGL